MARIARLLTKVDDIVARKTSFQKSIEANSRKFRTPAFVLEGFTSRKVAAAMIESNRQKEPFLVFDMDEAYRRIQHFKKIMPRVQMFYAMKANDDEMMLKLCMAAGLGFDCASPGEINKIRLVDDIPKKIIYAAPHKTGEQMSFANESGVIYTTFDTSYELKKIREFWPNARLLLRIRVDGDSVYKLGEKFGCDFETDAVTLLEEAASLGLSVVGIAFHVGSGCSSNDSYVLGLQRARALFDYEARAGRKMHIVDIGGGYMSDIPDRIDKVANLVNGALNDLFPEPAVQIVAEPGRYLCASSFTLYCSISNVKRVRRNGKPVNMIYFNDGIYGTLRFPEYWYTVHKFKRSTDIEEDLLEHTVLWGPSCDSLDRIMPNNTIMLPRCSPKDWLVFFEQGAYTTVFTTKFSCLGTPLIRTVISKKLRNQLKYSEFFTSEDFIENQDISTPLPTTLPPVLGKKITTHRQGL